MKLKSWDTEYELFELDEYILLANEGQTSLDEAIDGDGATSTYLLDSAITEIRRCHNEIAELKGESIKT